MEKRLFIAILVSIGFLWAWGALAPKMFPQLARPPQERIERVPEGAERPDADAIADRRADELERAADRLPRAETPTTAPPVGVELEPIEGRTHERIVVERPRYSATFTNRGGQLLSFRLKEYLDVGTDRLVELVRERPETEVYPFAIQSGNAALNSFANESLYAVERSTREGSDTVRFQVRDRQGRSVTKTFVFGEEHAFSYSIETERWNEPYRVVIGPGIGRQGGVADRFDMSGNLVVKSAGDYKMIKRGKVQGFQTWDNPTFIGVMDHYFLTAFLPEKSGSGTVRPVELPGLDGETSLRELWVGLNSEGGAVSGLAYFGPKKADMLERYELSETLQLGIFGFIAFFLLKALVWVNSFTNNFGWAIVFLTVMIKLVLYPLQHKSIVSMKRMQKVQPKMNAIRDKYRKSKTDPQQRQKMNVEMMELYKREGINPMSGCLPILLQLPILWAFYILLSNAIELRGEPFLLWITDLSAKDPYYITPILMTVTMFIQTWMMPSAADPMQRKIFLAMPIIFGWIFKEFPSGLVLYWLVQNLLTILQQGLMNRWWKQHPESLEKKGATP
jgi:YidC/Oxa1 family membrane protein insertase